MRKYQFAGMQFSCIEKVRDFIRNNDKKYGCKNYVDVFNKPIWLVENGKKAKIAIYDSPFNEGITYKAKYKYIFE